MGRGPSIEGRKNAEDARRGRMFTKLSREISVAARAGGGDPAGNPRLRSAIDKALAANMTKDTIERAIKKATGELEGVTYEEVRYEGYAPGGVAVIVDCVTDNRQRSVADVRHAFGKFGGNMGTEGSVAYLFKKRGVIAFDKGADEDRITEAAIEAGAEDVVALGAEGFEIRTAPGDLHAVATALEAAGLKLGGKRTTFVAKDTVKVTDPEKARTLLKLIDHLDDLDDVQHVHANFEMDDALMHSLSH